MESFLNRYRNITVLLLVIFAQLVLLAMQVKNDQDVRFIRVWAVTTVTPVARIVEWFRGGSIGFVRHYLLLHDASEENRKLRDEVGRLRIENTFLQNQLNTADRAKALQLFQTRTPSKMLAANIISVGAGGGSNAKVVFVNRGSAEGVMRGMAVVTPDGIVGKVITAYPTASEVLLVTDPEFAAGVVSQKSAARGTLKGQGTPMCRVEYVPFEEKVEVGEWFYTSGDDRVFPRGFPVGVTKVIRPGSPYNEILVEPSAGQHGLDDVLIILESAHQAIPDAPPVNQPVYIAPPPPQQSAPAPAPTDPANPAAQPATGVAQPTGTEADRLRSIYKSVGDAQKHNFGEGAPGSKPPDFTHLPSGPLPPGAPSPAASGPGQPAGTGVPVQKSAGPPNTPAPRQSPASGTAPEPATKPGGTATPGANKDAPRVPPPAPKTNTPAGTTAPRQSPAPGTALEPATKNGGTATPSINKEAPRVPPSAPKPNTPEKGAPGGPLPG